MSAVTIAADRGWQNTGLRLEAGKTYRLNGLGLADRVTNGVSRQLTDMRLVALAFGKETTIVPAAAATIKRQAEGFIEQEGSAQYGSIELNVSTRMEFDGFVMNTMRLTNPGKPWPLDKLSLVVRMPRDEAPCFVTTSGGWSATHGWTPDKWDSRETSSGSRVGNFVPYVFLTDSDRGFCWFADTDEGWLLDPNAPTMELTRDSKTVTFRVNFVTRHGPFKMPTTIKWGWMVSPQKPQPPGWRATSPRIVSTSPCSNSRPASHAGSSIARRRPPRSSGLTRNCCAEMRAERSGKAEHLG